MLVPYASLQHEYAEYYSGDPAFVAPPQPPADSAGAEAIETWKRLRAEYDARIDNARERSDWSGLRVEGTDEPTKFYLRPLPTDAYTLLLDMSRARKSDGSRVYGSNEIAVLTFKIALVRVENLGKVELEFEQHPRFGRIATTKFLDAAGIPPAIALAVAQEIGGVALERASRLPPKP